MLNIPSFFLPHHCRKRAPNWIISRSSTCINRLSLPEFGPTRKTGTSPLLKALPLCLKTDILEEEINHIKEQNTLTLMNDIGGKIFCIGDIHGCADRLTALMNLLPVDREKDTLVFLGDYINRGPDSAKVVDILLSIEKNYRRVIFLKGNHEQMLLEYARTSDIDLVPTLRMMGIEATTTSYGARVQSLQELSCFPQTHRDFSCRCVLPGIRIPFYSHMLISQMN